MPSSDLDMSGAAMNQKEKPGHPTQMMHKERMLTGKGMLWRTKSRLWSHRTAEVPQEATVDLPGRESHRGQRPAGRWHEGADPSFATSCMMTASHGSL